jgi:hypothetical protein
MYFIFMDLLTCFVNVDWLSVIWFLVWSRIYKKLILIDRFFNLFYCLFGLFRLTY